MEKYIIYYDESETSKKYISTIYRNSTSETKDIGGAIEFNKKDLALGIANYLSEREKETYKVLCVKTIMEEVKQ